MSWAGGCNLFPCSGSLWLVGTGGLDGNGHTAAAVGGCNIAKEISRYSGALPLGFLGTDRHLLRILVFCALLARGF